VKSWVREKWCIWYVFHLAEWLALSGCKCSHLAHSLSAYSLSFSLSSLLPPGDFPQSPSLPIIPFPLLFSLFQ
jgi:hypothetical protein